MEDGQIRDDRTAGRGGRARAQASGNATDGDRHRLEEVKISLDRCWDLLRQRRALREAGLDPEAAQARPEEVVEHYQQ
jgi:hypothetical protein